MRRIILLFFLVMNTLIFAQISLSEKAVDYFSMYNLTEGGKLSNMMVDLEPQSFLMAGPDFCQSMYMKYNEGPCILDMHYRVNRVGFGPISLSGEFKHSLLKFDIMDSEYDPDGEYKALEDKFFEDHPELAEDNLDSYSLQGSLVLFDAFEFGGMQTKVDQIDYKSVEVNLLDLSQIFGEQSFYLGETPVFRLSQLRTFNILTLENETVPAYSSFTYLGIPLLNSFSYDVFPKDDLTFISPTFNITAGPFMVYATPKWETNHSQLVSFSIGSDWAYFILYRERMKNRVSDNEMESMEDFMSANITGLNRDDYYNNGSFRFLLGYEYGQYNPYVSLEEKASSHDITLQLDVYMLSIDRRPYSPNALKEMEQGDDTHSPTKGPFSLVMHAGIDASWRLGPVNDYPFQSMIVKYYLKFGYGWFRNRDKK